MHKLYPMRLEATLHTRVWGGRKLANEMNKRLPTDEPYGESWELHDTSVVANGVYQGKTVYDLILEMRHQLVGKMNKPQDGMPLLAKILDAEDWLSVQVHPNDAQARDLEQEPRGKTEAWIVLAANDSAKLVIGLQEGTTQDAMADAIRDNTLENLLVYAEVQAGDVLYIPANTVHAIGPGLLIYEIQQSSDVTYRLYDWGRMGLDGKPRQLHTEKGIQVSNLAQLPEVNHPEGDVMVAGDYFITTRHHVQGEAVTYATNKNFQTLTCIEGTVSVWGGDVDTPFEKGQTILVPAGLETFTLTGYGTVLRSWQRHPNSP